MPPGRFSSRRGWSSNRSGARARVPDSGGGIACKPLTYVLKLAITGNVCWSNWAGLGVFRGLAEVRIQEGESLENALRRFKRKVQQEDIIKEVKRHSFYLKPGEKKRTKEALARKRSRKKARKDQD